MKTIQEKYHEDQTILKTMKKDGMIDSIKGSGYIKKNKRSDLTTIHR